MIHTAKFSLGQVVCHTKQAYRGVIIDIDASFQPSGSYNPIYLKHSFAIANPWYRILVDDSNLITYVSEKFLKLDKSQNPVEHPKLIEYLLPTKEGYQAIYTVN